MVLARPSGTPRGGTTDDLSAWVRQIEAGDRDAMSQLYDRTCRLVYGLALRMLRRREDAEELVVDVYTQVWRNAGRFDPQRGSVEAWLIIVTRSRAVDRLRARAARPDLDSAQISAADAVSDDSRPDRLLDVSDARRRAGAMLATLARDERRLIELAFFEGYTHSELSALLGLPLGTVKTRIRTSLLKMRGLRSLPRTGRAVPGPTDRELTAELVECGVG